MIIFKQYFRFLLMLSITSYDIGIIIMALANLWWPPQQEQWRQTWYRCLSKYPSPKFENSTRKGLFSEQFVDIDSPWCKPHWAHQPFLVWKRSYLFYFFFFIFLNNFILTLQSQREHRLRDRQEICDPAFGPWNDFNAYM